MLAGAKELRNWTRKLLVWVAPGRQKKLAALFEEIRLKCPGEPWQFMAGLKTASILGGRKFDDQQAWQSVALECDRLITETGCTDIVFDHESALYDKVGKRWDYWNKLPEMNLDWLRRCLTELPTNAVFWWYPSSSNGNDVCRDTSLKMDTVVVETIPQVRFITYQFERPPKNGTWHPELNAIRRMAQPGRPTVPILYTNPPWEWAWGPDRIKQGVASALSTQPADVSIIYPGYTDFAHRCRILAMQWGCDVKTIVATPEVDQ